MSAFGPGVPEWFVQPPVSSLAIRWLVFRVVEPTKYARPALVTDSAPVYIEFAIGRGAEVATIKNVLPCAYFDNGGPLATRVRVEEAGASAVWPPAGNTGVYRMALGPDFLREHGAGRKRLLVYCALAPPRVATSLDWFAPLRLPSTDWVANTLEFTLMQGEGKDMWAIKEEEGVELERGQPVE